MSIFQSVPWLWVALAAPLIACACATKPIDRQMLLAEIVHLYTRAEIESGVDVQGVRLSALRATLKAKGNTDQEIVDGSAALVRFSVYWHNAKSGIQHSFQKATLVEKGLIVSDNNIVEIRADGGKGVISRVRFLNREAGHCEYQLNQRNGIGKTLDLVNPLGGPGSTSLFCPDLEADGWQSRSFGPYDARVWFKPLRRRATVLG